MGLTSNITGLITPDDLTQIVINRTGSNLFATVSYTIFRETDQKTESRDITVPVLTTSTIGDIVTLAINAINSYYE